MTRSYKMLVLLAALNQDSFPGEIALSDLVEGVRRIASRSAVLAADVGAALHDTDALRKLLVQNPLAAWCGGRGTGGALYFQFAGDVFRSTIDVPSADREAFQRLAREIVDWRIAEYLTRDRATELVPDVIRCKVSHAGGTPILFLPDRAAHPGLPSGDVPVQANGREHVARFVKIAVNVLQEAGQPKNVLRAVLRGWFGEDAGLPGTDSHGVFRRSGEGWLLEPEGRGGDGGQLEVERAYTRKDLAALLELEFKAPVWNQGYVPIPGHVLLFVTLDKGGMPDEHRYEDQFVDRTTFMWKSQNRHAQASKAGQLIRNHAARGVPVHLFVRKASRISGKTAPFVYCGQLVFGGWHGNKPITVEWELQQPLSDRLVRVFDLSIGSE